MLERPLKSLLDLVLPEECAACRRPGTAWCHRCARALEGVGFGGGPRRVLPEPIPSGLPVTHAWGAYDGPLRGAIGAWKDADRRDAVAILLPLLVGSVRSALDAAGWTQRLVLLVPAPSSRSARRRRGDRPLHDLVRRVASELGAEGLSGVRFAPVLDQVHHVADQSGLGARERSANLRGSLRVNPLWHNVIRGRRGVIVDDVITSGSTLAEAARALGEAAGGDVVAATIAATQRRGASGWA